MPQIMSHDVSDAVLEAAARPYTPLFRVHPHDHLFAYIVANGGADGVTAYFRGGQKNARQAAAARAQWLGERPARVLEFAAGYGRVARYRGDAFAGDDYVASDIHPAACDFMTAELGVATTPSADHPEEVALPGPFDFIFVLSLFSHLPGASFRRWLALLYEALAPGGVLLFTTHGPFAADKTPGFFGGMLGEGGWGYRPISDQPDLDPGSYGTMLATPRYVLKAIDAIGARLLGFRSGAWFQLQDEWVIARAG